MQQHAWKIGRGKVLGPAPFFIAGVVNVTPDSFYDGGKCAATEDAVRHGRVLAGQGAHILDIGGESTRPFAEPVSEAEELRRVIPVVRELAKNVDGGLSIDDSGPVVSVDTTKAEVARQALQAGALIVNDVSACRFDPALLDVLVEYQPGYVLMHTQGGPRNMQRDPKYADVVSEVSAFFEEQLGLLTEAGLKESRIVLDPGIGFGKTLEHNLAILQHIDRFRAFGLPVYVGLSNKSLWGGLLGLGVDSRQEATVVATALMAAKGVAIHRVHDVSAADQALKIVQAIA
ncbi:MAG: dihydropteroate synthase [Desulfovibrionaceae bacterium]